MNEDFKTTKLNKERAEMEILAIRDQIAAFGANDYELPAINELIKEVRNGAISPEVALREAVTIKFSKNDHH